MKSLKKMLSRITWDSWLLAAVLLCLLPVAARISHAAYNRWGKEREGREAALKHIRMNALTIKQGENEPWRLTFQRLLTDRHGLWFFPPASPGGCAARGSDDAHETAFEQEMASAVARRFAPGELERLAEEARQIYQDYLTKHPDAADGRRRISPVPSIGEPSGKATEAGKLLLAELDRRCGFPTLNEPGRGHLTRHVSSGSRGHAIRIHGIPDAPRQEEIIGTAQEILDAGTVKGLVFIVFRDDEFERDLGLRADSSRGPVRMSRILINRNATAESPADSAPDSDAEIAPRPTPQAFDLDHGQGDPTFTRDFEQRAGYQDFQVSSYVGGICVEVYGVHARSLQDIFLEVAREAVSSSGPRDIYLEFRDRRVFENTVQGRIDRPQEKVLRSHLLKKEDDP
ncbi:MAG: hypothetical protein EOP88_07745 [Verrucomicrobiaceae bacterium]|nr:MAG: hypothetical protein EOP88_07745 [Verrucomicrobiaceae bacterium]